MPRLASPRFVRWSQVKLARQCLLAALRLPAAGRGDSAVVVATRNVGTCEATSLPTNCSRAAVTVDTACPSPVVVIIINMVPHTATHSRAQPLGHEPPAGSGSYVGTVAGQQAVIANQCSADARSSCCLYVSAQAIARSPAFHLTRVHFGILVTICNVVVRPPPSSVTTASRRCTGEDGAGDGGARWRWRSRR